MTHSFLRQICARPRLVLLALLAIVLAPRATAAQVVTDPRLVEFTPSSNHSTLLSDGRAMVDRYLFKVYAAGAAEPFQTLDMGKPSPGADGIIRYDFSATVTAWPLPGGDYESRVDAVGPGGNGLSTASNLFTFSSLSCTYALTGTSASFPAAGGGGSVGVTTAAACAWTARSNVSWVTLGSTGGTGSATVIFDVAANTASTSRTGTVTVAGAVYTISQQGAGCGYSLSVSTQSYPSSGGTGSVTVASSGGCSWTAVSNVPWVTVTAGASGTGAGTVTYTVAPNTGSTARTGTITIAGLTYTVREAAATGDTIPSPWQHGDVGGVSVSGSASYSAGVFTVQGAGADIGGSEDALHFVYQPVAADGEVVARVCSVTATSANAKAGVMLRQALAAGSREVSLVVLPGGTTEFLQRASPGGRTRVIAAVQTTAGWVKLTRIGRDVTASTSTDGTTWVVLATTAGKFSGSAYLGLAVTSADPAAGATGTFDQVIVR